MVDNLNNDKKLSSLLKCLWFHLNARRKYQFAFLLLLMLFSALTEVVSMSAVLPFLGVLTAPDKVFEYEVVAEITQAVGIVTAQDLILPLTLIFALAAIMAGLTRTLLLWFITRISFACGADLSYKAYKKTLYQPYEVHVKNNSSEVISGITIKVNSVVFGVLQQVLTLISSIILLLIISSALIIIDPVVALIAMFSFGISYILISFVTKKKLRYNSKLIAKEQTEIVKALQEGLGGIRDVIIDNAQELYCNIYRKSDIKLRKAQGENVFIAQSPRYLMETIGMVLIAGLAYILSQKAGGVVSILPVLGALAIGAQRLLPAMQQSYSAWSSILGNIESLTHTIKMLEQSIDQNNCKKNVPKIIFKKTIDFKSVSYRYSDNGVFILNNISLSIPSGARVGLIGTTGSGKSTAIDLLMGLLTPTLGTIRIDGVEITKSQMNNWQSIIAHVPQHIFLTDNTILENIALGVTKDNIDIKRVKYAAKQAQIATYIEELPESYQTSVGERGVKLSGGQRQRIGIARALYKDASVLFFDEATSALDNNTEQAVMNAIGALNENLTIIIIAHRLSTVKSCDIIFELENGEVIAQGTYEHLLEFSSSFRKLVESQV